MIPLPHCTGKTLAILGLGKTGFAAVAALEASGATLFRWDDKAQDEALMHYDSWPWDRLDALLVSPGIPLTHPAPHPAIHLARTHHVPLTSDIELLQQACPDAMYVGITGTNGKSTTTALIGHILKHAGRNVQVGGNIGTPALAMTPLAGGGIFVLELSSYQLDLLRAPKMQVAVWLNISPDHLDRHGDMEGYIAAKARLFSGQGAEDMAVIGIDDPYSEAMARQLIAGQQQQVIPISVTQTPEKGICANTGTLTDPQTGFRCELDELQTLRGTHNHQNFAAAYATCRALGIDSAEIMDAAHSFPGLAHRMQRITEVGGVVYINDSKATNADAAARSLGSYEHIHWIAGGVAKAGGIASLAPYFPRIRRAYLIGEAQDAFAKTLEGRLGYERCGTLEQAVSAAHMNAQPGDVVLLAPACASFDQFANFEQRGDAFAAAAKALG